MTRRSKAGGRSKAPPADPMIEALAEIEHQQWCVWAKHMLAHNTPSNSRRWRRQIATPYTQLSESDKEKDRVFARRVLAAVAAHLACCSSASAQSRKSRE